MNKLVKVTLTMATIFMLAGCGKPTLDTSSEEALKASVQEIMADLSKEDQQKFQKSLGGIYMLGALASLGNSDAEDAAAKINAKLDGKTAEEIFEMADELR